MPAQQPGVMQRRHSSASSSDAASDHGMNSRHTSQENVSLIPTRTSKVATSKPAANPLQFIKVGPCDLYRTAQEQLKKVEEVKKVKQERRDEAEDWQSNLDNWKCSRRKRQEHIIERVVEVKKFELEEFDRNRRRSKTFSEMLEERNSKGRKLSLPVYKDDDNDLSELGLGSSKDSNGMSETNGEDSVFDELHKDISSEAATSQETTNSVKQNGLGTNGHSVEEKLNSNDTEEYTYERAIQSYVNFTESRVRGRSLTPSSEDAKICNGFSKKPSPPVPAKPRRNSCKIEEKLTELQEIKKKSVSTTDLNNDAGRRSVSVPKVDISKRRELFEKSVEEEQNTKINRLSGDFGSSKSIRERLSTLGKQSDETSSGNIKKLNRLSAEISVKDRLSSIEKNKSMDNVNTVKVSRITSETGQQSVKERLSSLQKETPNDKVTRNRVPSEISSIKDRLTSLDAACHKEIPRTIVPEQEIIGNKMDDFQEEKKLKDENFERAFSPEEEIYESKRQQHYRHRSLDSLDVDSTDGLGNESFERVQSLEDLDFCRNYPASSLSGDTDREDSGINTADVSSSVSQADDCDLHLDDDIKLHHQPPIMEELPKQLTQETKTEFNSLVKESETQNKQISVSCLSEVKETETVVVESPSCFLKLPLRLEMDPLPVILESPSEPYPAFDIIDKINEKIQEESVCDQNSSFELSTKCISDSEIKTNDQIVNKNTDTSSIENSISNAFPNKDSNIFNNIPDSSLNNIEDSNALPDSCPNNIVNTTEPCDEDLASGSPLSVSKLSMDITEGCMQDETVCSGDGGKRKTVVEICHKIDSNELTSPLPTPFISVDTDFNFNTEEKFEDSLEMSDDSLKVQTGEKVVNKEPTFVEEKTLTHFQALTVDVPKQDDVNILPTTGEKSLQKSTESLLTVDKVDMATVDTTMVNTSTEPNTLYLNNEFNLSGDVVFPLSPTALEPPKEKPPPPPTETSDDDDGSLNEKSSPLRRLDSTKRIKKEIRQKRSSFLGLNDGLDDDSYLEPELEVRPPPDMTTFLAEERRLEQMMYRQSICSESDSNQESRDSGVELEKHPDDLTWSRLHHSRDNSETFGNTSTTSEEEEIIKKEREIIEILEQEELNRYQSNSQNDQDNIGEKLALRLRELEQEKSRLEWERHEEVARRRAEETARNEHENRIQAREQELRKQETVVDSIVLDEETAFDNDNQHLSMEMLLSEREHLEKEQEALIRQRESIMQQQWSSSMQDISVTQQSTTVQDVNGIPVPNYRHSLISNTHSQADYRQSMPDLATTQPRRPPPPIPPSKPIIVPRNQEKRTSSPQQMSRQTIQALSAAPRSRLISNDNWMQTKRKPKVVQDNNYNYQHWLIQEAEHRRITEQHQRQAPPPRRPAPPQSHSQTGPWPQNGNPQYTNWQPSQQKSTHWAAPPQEQQQNSQWASPPQSTQHQQNLQWTPAPHQQSQTQPVPQRPSPPQQQQWVSTQSPPQHHPTAQPRSDKPLPDSIIQTLTQRVQNRINSSDTNNNRRRVEPSPIVESRPQSGSQENQEKMLSVSGKKKCSHCGDELGRGAAMIIESLRLFYHINCFKCCVCCVQLGDGLMGTDVRVRNNKLHCHNCYSSDDGVKFSCV